MEALTLTQQPRNQENTAVKRHSFWYEIKHLMIVLPYHNETQFNEFRMALDSALNDSNVIALSIVAVIPSELKKEALKQHHLITYLSPKDFTVFGKIKNDSVATSLVQPYDALCWIEVADKKISKAFKGVKAKMKLGVNTPNSFFNINASTRSSNPVEILNFAKHTLEKISLYE